MVKCGANQDARDARGAPESDGSTADRMEWQQFGIDLNFLKTPWQQLGDLVGDLVGESLVNAQFASGLAERAAPQAARQPECTAGDCQNGVGTFVYASGAAYEGECSPRRCSHLCTTLCIIFLRDSLSKICRAV